MVTDGPFEPSFKSVLWFPAERFDLPRFERVALVVINTIFYVTSPISPSWNPRYVYRIDALVGILSRYD
jgi:hypothetical protein